MAGGSTLTVTTSHSILLAAFTLMLAMTPKDGESLFSSPLQLRLHHMYNYV